MVHKDILVSINRKASIKKASEYWVRFLAGDSMSLLQMKLISRDVYSKSGDISWPLRDTSDGMEIAMTCRR